MALWLGPGRLLRTLVSRLKDRTEAKPSNFHDTRTNRALKETTASANVLTRVAIAHRVSLCSKLFGEFPEQTQQPEEELGVEKHVAIDIYMPALTYHCEPHFGDPALGRSFGGSTSKTC